MNFWTSATSAAKSLSSFSALAREKLVSDVDESIRRLLPPIISAQSTPDAGWNGPSAGRVRKRQARRISRPMFSMCRAGEESIEEGQGLQECR